jgi:hypothetical protein
MLALGSAIHGQDHAPTHANQNCPIIHDGLALILWVGIGFSNLHHWSADQRYPFVPLARGRRRRRHPPYATAHPRMNPSCVLGPPFSLPLRVIQSRNPNKFTSDTSLVARPSTKHAHDTERRRGDVHTTTSNYRSPSPILRIILGVLSIIVAT